MDVARVRHLGTLSQEAFSDLRDGEAAASAIDQLRVQLESVAQKVDGMAAALG